MKIKRVSEHVLQVALPAPTLPPAYETNSYLVYDGDCGLIVDAGSGDRAELTALLDTVAAHGVHRITGLVASHCHPDHITGMQFLHETTQANIFVHAHDYLPVSLHLGLVKPQLQRIPDHFCVNGLRVDVQHAPGHTKGHVHLLIQADSVILVGDHLTGEGSVWIGPPDGHMGSYYRALDAIVQSGCKIAGPGHGRILENAAEAALTLKARRMAREEQILNALCGRWMTLKELVEQIYSGNVASEALWAAEKTVLAHLEHLLERTQIRRCENSQTDMLYTSVQTEPNG